jgi:ABC-type arginine/histidine transport system permease subunit
MGFIPIALTQLSMSTAKNNVIDFLYYNRLLGGHMLKLIAIVFVIVVAVDVYFNASPLNALAVFVVLGFFYLVINFLMEELATKDD